MKFRILFLVVFIVSIVPVSCKKYSDGPALSLRSKKERIANTWVIEKAIRNGNDVTNDYEAFTLTLTKDGDANLVATYLFFGVTTQYNTNGTWTFNSSKERIIFDYQNNNADNEYQILRLKENELWLRDVGGEDEVHLQPA